MTLDKLLQDLAGKDGIEAGEFVVTIRKMRSLPPVYEICAKGGSNQLSTVASLENMKIDLEMGKPVKPLPEVAADIAKRMWPDLKIWGA